jgi:Asp/Glu/hydantoin racemase
VSSIRTLLILNPNSSTVVTNRLAEEAKRVAPADTSIRALTNPAGPVGIQTPAELDAAREWVLATIAANADCAAAIIGAFGDPGLEEARATAVIRVVGLGEAGILAAAEGGCRFSIVTAGAAMRAALLQKIETAGLRNQLASLRYLPHTVLDVVRDRERVLADAIGTIGRCIKNDGADMVLLGGAPFAGAAYAIGREITLPVIDGVEAAIRLAISRLS